MVIAISAGLCASITHAGTSDDATVASVNKQKAEIIAGLTQADDYCTKIRLQDAKNKIDLLLRKLSSLQGKITKEEAASFKTKIDTIAARTTVREDSLAKIPLTILHTAGVDEALAYIQNDLKKFGVSEKKINNIEKIVLREAPKVRQEMEKQAIQKAIILLQNGKTPPPGTDPYIIAAAQRSIKAHNDSLTALENEKKRKDAMEKQRQERIAQEKIAKDKKEVEAKAEKLRKEQEKIRLAEIEHTKKQLAIADKAHKDSVAALQRDSIAKSVKQQQQLAMQEKQRRQKLEELQKQPSARKNESLNKTRTDTVALKPMTKDNPVASRTSPPDLQQLEKERLEQMAAEEKKQKQIKLEEENRKKLKMAASSDSFEAVKRMHDQEMMEAREKQEVKDRARAMALDLTQMLDKNQALKAMDKLQDQGLLLSSLEPEEYNALEHAIVVKAIQELTEPVPPSKRNAETAKSPLRQSLDKIYSLVRNDKIDVAYKEFKFTENSLADFLSKAEFRQLKFLVEEAYRLRKISTLTQ